MGIQQAIKAILYPVTGPLRRRLNLPFAVMLPRIEALEREVRSYAVSPPEQAALRETVAELREGVSAVRTTMDNFVRTWLRLQNEVSHLAGTVPDIAANACADSLAALEARIRQIERTLAEHDRPAK